jgi:hypothetical protein
MSALIAVVVSIGSLVAVPFARSQTGAGTDVPRFGTLAPSLTEDDIQQIRRLATRTGGELWLVFGDRGGWVTNPWWVVGAYRKPTVVAGGARIGEVVQLKCDVSTNPASKRVWVFDGVGMYAQVVVSGRMPESVESDMDRNRPFRLLGEWQPDEIAGLVEFIRSSPSSAGAAKGLAMVNGALSISSVQRESGGRARVTLRLDPRELQVVQLAKKGATWTVTSVHVIALD